MTHQPIKVEMPEVDETVSMQHHPILKRLSPVGLQVLLKEALKRDYAKN